MSADRRVGYVARDAVVVLVVLVVAVEAAGGRSCRVSCKR